MISEIEAFTILNSIPYLGAVKIRKLIDFFGSAVEAVNAKPSDLASLSGFQKVVPQWEKAIENSNWQQDIELTQRLNVQILPFTDPQFPKALLQTPDHPVILYIQGTLKPQDQRAIAVVGTRNASIYGNEMAEQISMQLVSHGFTIVSGLARGVDTAAHRGALQAKGRTLAVIGSGLTKIYPNENIPLAKEIAQQGALISEFPMCTPPDRQNFPQRNRIVSGMTLGTLLIEAPIKSGAMITMECAHKYRKKLFTLPGRADNDNFRGNHLLIKNGQAHLIENGDDIAVHFQSFLPLTPQLSKVSNLYDREETEFLTKMPNQEIGIEALVTLTGIPIQHTNRILMSLILKKAIKEFPGKIYKKQEKH